LSIKTHRAELTALQHAQHVVERKKVWVAMHPETKHGGAPGAGKGKGKKKVCKGADSASFQSEQPAPLPFAEETARATGACRRTVEKSAQIGENLCRKVHQLLAGTPVEDRKTNLPRQRSGRRPTPSQPPPG
jgi:ParB family chromosome partitioning protein